MSLFKSNSFMKAAKSTIIVGGAALSLIAAPAASAADIGSIDIDGINLNFGDEDLLQGLIEMDADEIAELRTELADAKEEIRSAIGEIKGARAEAAKSDEAEAILIAALAEAATSVEEEVKEAFDEVRAELKDAKSELKGMKSSLTNAEYNETNDLISYLQSELGEFETILDELVAAMRS